MKDLPCGLLCSCVACWSLRRRAVLLLLVVCPRLPLSPPAIVRDPVMAGVLPGSEAATRKSGPWLHLSSR